MSGTTPHSSSEAPTRRRLLEAGLQLFASQGFAATTTAAIEKAAGLTPGAGGLFRHFPTKRDLLDACFDLALERAKSDVVLARPDQTRPLEQWLGELALSLLDDFDSARALVGLTEHDLADFPELFERARDHLTQDAYHHVALWLALLPDAPANGAAASALAVILVGAVVNYWSVSARFGVPPLDVDQQAFLDAWVALAASAVAH